MVTSWHHSPVHQFVPNSTYMVTGGTYNKLPYFRGHQRLTLLQDLLLTTLLKYGWQIQAWAVFVNHYHFIARASAGGIKDLIRALHSVAAKEVNKLDGIQGRQVLFQYWDTSLTYEASWLARLNYVNNNAVHHRLVANALNYPYCSAGWFQQEINPSFRRKVESFRFDLLKMKDEF
jgi:putative transposase